MKKLRISETAHHVFMFLFINMIYIDVTLTDATTKDPSVRIAAYDPKPTQPYMMIARRIGEGPSVIQDPPRPPRHAQIPRNRRPLDSRRVTRRPFKSPSQPSSDTFQEGQNRKETEVEVGNSSREGFKLVLLSPDQLRNPHKINRIDEEESQLPSPVGPPTPAFHSSSETGSPIRTAFSGVIQPPGIHPPSSPLETGGTPGNFGVRPLPPAPPTFAPAPPTVRPGPPTEPQPAMTPAPPEMPREGSQVSNITCRQFGGIEKFEATLTLPNDYEAVPVLEDRPMIDPTTNPFCRMIPTQLVGMFQLIVSSYEACGVRSCRQSNGETWNCLVLRFPRINGLKLPEDEIIEIRCRPHDRVADDIHVLAVATSNHTNKPPTVFEGLQEFECEIGLFRQLPGTQQFITRVNEKAPLELGEKVQLWSIVKGGDGWEYSRLSEVVIQKEEADRERSTHNTIVLVFSDGCRNPAYKVIAEDHPFRDDTNKLMNRFTFRAFMFQDMQPGDSLLISAKVVGCVLEEDCRPATCPDDGEKGYGRRRREADIKEFTITTKMTVPPSVTASSITTTTTTSRGHSLFESHVRRGHNVTDWSRNLAIKVRMPDDSIQQKSIQFSDCKLYLFISLGIGLFFCTMAIVVVSFTLLRKRKKSVLKHPNPPSAHSKRSKKKPLQIKISSGSETTYTASETSSSGLDLRRLPVPPTVRQRKREVNAELMGLFGDGNMMPINGPYPPMVNYYGYMVVPRPPPGHQKKSLRAMKRNGKARSLPHLREEQCDMIPSHSPGKPPFHSTSLSRCSCHTTTTEEDRSSDTESQMSNHTSVIRITSSGSETISQGSSSFRPKPRPRLTRTDNIYSEILQDTPPTLV